MTNEERLKAAGWRCSRGTNPPSSHEWSRDGIDWYTQAEALVEVLTAERDAAIARAERAEADARSVWRIIGEIEAVVGIAGSGPAADTVARIRSLRDRAERAEAALDLLVSTESDLERMHARAEAAEALAASRLDVSPEDAALTAEIVWATSNWSRETNDAIGRVRAALRAHAAKVSR